MKSKITISIDEIILDKIDSYVKSGKGKNRSQVLEELAKEKFSDFVDMSVVIFCHDKKWDNRSYPFDEPKSLLDVQGKTIIARQIEIFRRYGIKNFIITIPNDETITFKNALKKYKDELHIEFVECDTNDKTGTALRKVLKYNNNKHIVISNGDIYYGSLNFEEYFNYHKAQKSDFSLCLKFVLNPEQLGNVRINGNKIIEFVERPDASQMNLTNSGLYITTAKFLEEYNFGDYLEKDFFPKLPHICNNIGYIYSGQWEHIQNDSAYERVNGWLM